MKNIILITGYNGFIGSNLYPEIEKKYINDKIIKVNKSDFDLTKENDVINMFKNIKPNIIIHLAGKVGGILTNKENPVEFFNDNILINTFTFKYSKEFNIKKLVTFIGGCSYPANAISPIIEDCIWDGYPQEESAAYSTSKKMLLVLSKYYRKQYGLNSIVLIPGNVYGEYDNFDLYESHVIPAIIRKMLEAKLNNENNITLWGDGESIRDFVYIKDVIKIILYMIENYDISDPINISSGVGIKIKDLAKKIKGILEYRGNIIWDLSKPKGQDIKIFDIKKLNSMGLYCNTTIDIGLKNTINWYKNINNISI